MKWGIAAIAEVCEPTEQRDPRQDPAGEFHYVHISGIDRVLKTIVEHQTLLGANAPSRAKKVIRKDDILVSTVRPNLNAVAMVPACLDDQIASTGFCVLRPHRARVEPRYLFYCTVASAFVDDLTSRVRGANYPAVSDHDVKETAIPLPSLTEQRRIVEVLDQADRLRRLLTEVDAKANHVFPAFFTHFLGSPESWGRNPRSRPLQELVEFVGGATPSKRIPQYWRGDIPWISPKDMKSDFLLDSSVHVSRIGLDATNLTLVEAGNPAIVVRGMILARDVPVALVLCPATINQDIKVLVPKTSQVSGAFLWASLVLAKTHLRSLVRIAGHGTRKLDTPDLMRIPVVVPRVKEIEHVEAAVRIQRSLQERSRRRRNMLDNLRMSLSARAFDGSLTATMCEAQMEGFVREIERQTSESAAVAP